MTRYTKRWRNGKWNREKGVIFMDLSFIVNLYIPVVMVICLCVGYILKHWMKDLDNKVIPTILALLGAVLACMTAWDISVELMASGMVTGLASTGLHQAFKQIMEKKE